MDIFFLISYLGFSLAFLAAVYFPEGGAIPLWLGGSFTPHGSFLNNFNGKWVVFFFWSALLILLVGCGHYLYLPPLISIAVALISIFFISGFVALAFRLSSYSSTLKPAKKEELHQIDYDRFRIFCASATDYAKLCQQASISSRMVDTPYSFLKEIPKSALKTALSLVPNLIYQPVVPQITEKVDEYLSKHREEVESHAEKSLTAQADFDTAREEIEKLKAKIDLLEKSELQARKDLERMQSRSRTATTKNFTEMSVEELKVQRAALIEEMRKIDQAIRNQQPSTITQASLPNMNP